MRPLSLLLLLFLTACGSPEDPSNGANWVKRSAPVLTGEYGVASDPDVVRDGDGYRMCYTCLDPDTGHTALCGATSADGIHWSPAPAGGRPRGLLLSGLPGTDEAALEGCALLRRDNQWLLFYSAYPSPGDPVSGFPASLYRASSEDGEHYIRDGRVLAPQPGGHDNDAVYSPSFLNEGGTVLMIYTGHCYTRCTSGYGPVLLAARSDDALHWTRVPDFLVAPSADRPWSAQGIGEAAVFIGPGPRYNLLVTGRLGDGERPAVWLAQAAQLSGPWSFSGQPVLSPSGSGFDAAGLLAPTVQIEGDRMRVWYFGLGRDGHYAIGEAETRYPPTLH